MRTVVIALTALGVVWVPGAIASLVLRLKTSDFLSRIAEELAMGIAFWPLLFLWTSTVGMRWPAVGAKLTFAFLVVLLITLTVRRARLVCVRPVSFVIVVVVVIVVLTRICQVQAIPYPLWVDSVHHTTIIRLLVEGGRLPSTYAPFMPQSTFYYHWGFHAVVAFVAWISGETKPEDIPRLLLIFGQVLNVLTFFAVYCGANALLKSRLAAVLAGTLATLVSLFPAYYVAWGRYTQLSGLLLLPPLAAAVWSLGRHPDRGTAAKVALLGGGLLLLHVRVAAVFVILSAILFILLVLQRRWRGLVWCMAAAIGAIGITTPWLAHIAVTQQVRTILSPGSADRFRWETPNDIPSDVLWAPNNMPLLIVSTAGLLGLTALSPLSIRERSIAIAWWLILVMLFQRQALRERCRFQRRLYGWRIGIIATWIFLTALVVNLDTLGFPRFRLLSNSSTIIMLFLPLSICGAHLLHWAIGAAIVKPSRTRMAMNAMTVMIAAAGASTMIDIVNQRTVLVTSADVDALTWIRHNTPPTARFAVGVQPWIGGSYVGVDGGYWIPVVTDRSSILPPGLYPWVMPGGLAAIVTQQLTTWHDAEERGNTAVVSILKNDGVTHLYFGPGNSAPIHRVIAASPLVKQIYASQGVEIYLIR